MITGKLKKSQSEVSIRQGDERLIRLTEQAGNKVSSLLSRQEGRMGFCESPWSVVAARGFSIKWIFRINRLTATLWWSLKASGWW